MDYIEIGQSVNIKRTDGESDSDFFFFPILWFFVFWCSFFIVWIFSNFSSKFLVVDPKRSKKNYVFQESFSDSLNMNTVFHTMVTKLHFEARLWLVWFCEICLLHFPKVFIFIVFFFPAFWAISTVVKFENTENPIGIRILWRIDGRWVRTQPKFQLERRWQQPTDGRKNPAQLTTFTLRARR